MLRRKMVMVFATLLVLLVLTAVGAIWMLQEVLEEMRSGRAEAADRLWHIVLGLTLVFIVLINLSIVAVLRITGMVLRPVERLIEGTRELAAGRYGFRVAVERDDEFAELARSYNALAAQLADNERRKLEVLGQVGLTLNHELNNAAAIIELQLQLLSRQAAREGGGTNPRLERCAREIREGLGRMNATVENLKHVRRIVLTDYVSGVKMLDLERSVMAADESAGEPESVAGSSVTGREVF